ncbi:MAG TPA: hypothetical protein ENG70_02215 [Candidatus Cloacimonetes bacterium]|nr:hypothetical protein [Candidatus Cloacimonadota bacterium]HEX37660.1 hypothetical protein [Candidatus Cloacimonadota bacterium]
MAQAYTPGLTITKSIILKKDRILPLKGEVVVKVGDKVKAEDVVAKTDLPGDVQPINIGNKLGIPPSEVEPSMLKKAGEKIKKDEIIAQTKSFFGLFRSSVKSPITGTIENISSITGQVLLREPPVPIDVKAFIEGVVTKVYEEEGVQIENKSAYIQGIFGIGGEITGEIKVLVDAPDAELMPEQIDNSCTGKIIVGGSMVRLAAIKKAIQVNAKGIVVGGIDDQDLKDLLGFDIGVAITGHEEIGLTLVLTEGFGPIKMATKTFDILKQFEGYKASMHGKTQIRAGVMRPEIIIPIPFKEAELKEKPKSFSGLKIGSIVRIIREPHFGEICTVTALPEELVVVESETKVRVLKAKMEDGIEVTIPRANVEAIED